MEYELRKHPKELFVVSIISVLPISFIIGSLIFQLNLIMIIISFLSDFFKSQNKMKFVEDKNEIKIFLIILLYLIFNTIISEDWSISIRRNILYFEFFLLAISLRYFLVNENILKKVVTNWFFIICLVSLDVFFEYKFGFNSLGFTNETGYTGRIASFFKDELIVGSFLLSFIIPIFSYLYLNKQFKLSIFFFFLCSAAIFLSGERSSFLKLLIAFILITYLWDYKNHLKKYILSILIFLIFLISLTTNINQSKIIKHNIVHKYYSTTLNIISIDKEKSFKQNLMNSRYLNQGVFSYEIFKNNIFFGVGNKNYFKACHKYVIGNEKNLCYTHPHQTYYELMSEHGIIGSAIILVSLIYLILFNNVDNLNKRKLTIFRIFLLFLFLPLIPSGSFFSSQVSSLFWINYTFYTIYRNKLIAEKYEKN